MKSKCHLVRLLNSPMLAASALGFAVLASTSPAESFDAAPFGLPLPEGQGLMWEDPREIHRVIVTFKAAAPANGVRLEYWGSRWPQQRLPKDQEPGGGDVGWYELGNWYKYGWRAADTEAKANGLTLTFTFHPVDAKEFPKVSGYRATFRYTHKIRLVSDTSLPPIETIQTFTDSTLSPKRVRLAWAKNPGRDVQFTAFNGAIEEATRPRPGAHRVRVQAVVNSDPNTFDRTLVSVRNGQRTFTFLVDDLDRGALYLPDFGVAVLADSDERDYGAIAAERSKLAGQTLYDRVAALPEQTWKSAWEGMPPKKSRIYLPMGLDGGRQRFRLNADGSINFRSNDQYLKRRPGQDTPRLALEMGPIHVRFQLPDKPVDRFLDEGALPVCTTIWDLGGVRVEQTAIVTELGGTQPNGPVPAGDAFAVWMARFTFTNSTQSSQTVALPIAFGGGPAFDQIRLADGGIILDNEHVRGQVESESPPTLEGGKLKLTLQLESGQKRTVLLKVPYVVLTESAEREALTQLNFDRERKAVADYWRRRLEQSARLVTPEPMLNEFYRAHANHLLVNCEREPGSDRRFARVGSFSYGAYGNESCMMVVDLDRRGYHQEAQNCLDAWLQYQGTVALPGDFSTREGVLYGAGGYEAGGYNQHHGWILWMIAEHYRFTRDAAWLRQAAAGMIKGADWIIKETARTHDRHELERGLLPAGSLEDIGDWWTWLSTSCYSWRGLDAAAWALGQIKHPDANRIRKAAEAYHTSLVTNFRKAAERAPVVRLRDGTAVPHFPSHVHRRGRSFGWICETLEGALHLLITRAIDPSSPEATWIVKDYEDNLYLSNQYGYTLADFEPHWFSRGGMSMQACLLLGVEPYLYRDDVKHALRALFNGQAVSYFPDVRMNTEHALPKMDDWRGDHFKSSDESNCAGWLRHLFVREEEDHLLIGQAVPRDWLKQGQRCGLENAATYFGKTSVLYTGGQDQVTVQLQGPTRNPPKELRVRLRAPDGRTPAAVTVNGKSWKKFAADWVRLPGDMGQATVVATY